jgi:hypothetical protein
MTLRLWNAAFAPDCHPVRHCTLLRYLATVICPTTISLPIYPSTHSSFNLCTVTCEQPSNSNRITFESLLLLSHDTDGWLVAELYTLLRSVSLPSFDPCLLLRFVADFIAFRSFPNSSVKPISLPFFQTPRPGRPLACTHLSILTFANRSSHGCAVN